MDPSEIQSRREFIHALGGQQHLARKLGMKSRQNVDFMITNGFSYKWKQRLIEEANLQDVEPHPELFKEPRPRSMWFSTDLSLFIRKIVQHHGGSFMKFSRKTKIPISSLRAMCESNGRVIKVHIPILEELARELNIPLPENWPKL